MRATGRTTALGGTARRRTGTLGSRCAGAILGGRLEGWAVGCRPSLETHGMVAQVFSGTRGRRDAPRSTGSSEGLLGRGLAVGH